MTETAVSSLDKQVPVTFFIRQPVNIARIIFNVSCLQIPNFPVTELPNRIKGNNKQAEGSEKFHMKMINLQS